MTQANLSMIFLTYGTVKNQEGCELEDTVEKVSFLCMRYFRRVQMLQKMKSIG